MNKKIFSTAVVFVMAVVFFASCNRQTEQGVVINGVRWATSNIDVPGTFAENPEDAGMLFQWNRKKAWNSTCENVENWDNSMSEGTKWYAENDPCPEGWRVPTYEELQSLRDADSGWTTQNGVNGRLFGNAPNQIFLPAVGFRTYVSGLLTNTGLWGLYWSSTRFDNESAHRLGFRYGSVSVRVPRQTNAFSIRCVAK